MPLEDILVQGNEFQLLYLFSNSICISIINIIGFAKYLHATNELKLNAIYIPYFLSETLYPNKLQIFTLEQQLHITYLTRETYLCKTVAVDYFNWNQTSNGIFISEYFRQNSSDERPATSSLLWAFRLRGSPTGPGARVAQGSILASKKLF